jgi:MYXO-CTERM domain-containing protein
MNTCVDDCAGTKCPQGQLCQMGSCIADPNAQVGGSSSTGGSGTGGDIPIIPIPTDPKPGTGGSAAGSSTGGTTGSTDGGSGMLSSGDGSGDAKGCGCSIPGGSSGAGAIAGLMLLGALGLRRRRG